MIEKKKRMRRWRSIQIEPLEQRMMLARFTFAGTVRRIDHAIDFTFPEIAIGADVVGEFSFDASDPGIAIGGSPGSESRVYQAFTELSFTIDGIEFDGSAPHPAPPQNNTTVVTNSSSYDSFIAQINATPPVGFGPTNHPMAGQSSELGYPWHWLQFFDNSQAGSIGGDALTTASLPTSFDLSKWGEVNVFWEAGHEFCVEINGACAFLAGEAGILIDITSINPVVVVNSTRDTEDAFPADGICDTSLDPTASPPAAASGECTLRAAAQSIPYRPGFDGIEFDIPGGEVPTISTSMGFEITEGVEIDGTTQPGGRVAISGTGSGTGVHLLPDSSGSTVRGLVINGFEDAIRISSDGNKIVENRIGTDSDGTLAIGNGTGITITGANNVVGGQEFDDRNLISGNRANGVHIIGTQANGNIVIRNFIGTNAVGEVDDSHPLSLGNAESGVLIEGGANNRIGGLPVDGRLQGNTIAGSGKSAVRIVGAAADSNTVRRNSIFGNEGIGVDLNDEGVTPNDQQDTDALGNDGQNFPLITVIDGESGVTKIGGTVAGEPNTTYTVDLYVTEVEHATSLEHALQGEKFLSSIDVTTDDTGFVHFETPIRALTSTEIVTAAATDQDGNTSEFSPFTPDRMIGSLDIRTPVLVVPGIFGSFAAAGEQSYNNYIEFLLNLGIAPEKLRIDPLAHYYDDVIATLEEAGYVKDRDLFIAPYDWRLPLAPGDAGVEVDGRLEIDAATITDTSREFGLDYLGHWLKEAAEAWQQRFGQPLAAVNIIAHSMGGLLSRSYIQSDAYGGSFTSATAGRDLVLPMVNSLTTFGTPYQGASKAWNVWHNNFVSDTAFRMVMSKVMNHAWNKLLAGEIINTPQGPLTLANIAGTTRKERELDFLRRYVRGAKDLLPTYDFAENFVATGFGEENRLLEDLNNDGGNLFAARVARTMVLFGRSETTVTTVQKHMGEPGGLGFRDEIVSFTDYIARDPDDDEPWYLDVQLDAGGDGTVPRASLDGLFSGDSRVELFSFCKSGDTCGFNDRETDGSVSHTGLPGNTDAQGIVVRALGHPLAPGQISTGRAIGAFDEANLVAGFALYNFTLDPVNALLVDGNGKRLGYTEATGVLAEIPGSIWFGGIDGMGWITRPIAEPLSLQLEGTGTNYFVQVSGTTAGMWTGVEDRGFLSPGETKSITVPPVQLPGDFNNDGRVGVSDLSILQAHFGQTAGPEQGDLTGDGFVDRSDFAKFASAFGRFTSVATSAAKESAGLVTPVIAHQVLFAQRRPRVPIVMAPGVDRVMVQGYGEVGDSPGGSARIRVKRSPRLR